MSFLPIRDENKEAPTGQTTNAPSADTTAPPQTGGSVGEEAGGAPAKTSASGSPTQFGSSASKLGDYLSANAPQIGQQADTLTGNLNQQYGNLTQGITDAANQFKQSVQGGYTAANPDVINQALQDPTAFASTPENIEAFQKQYNDQYTGPLSFEGTDPYSNLQGQIGQAMQQGNLLSTQAGLESYLKGNAPNPTQAMTTLDALLLRGNPEAQQKINQAAGQFGNLEGQFGTATQGANQSALDAQKAAQDAAAYARGQFDPYVQGFASDLTTRAADAEAQRRAYNLAQQKAYNELTPLNSYLSTFNADTGYNIENPFASILSQNPMIDPITAQTFSTPDQYAKAQAIQQLLGGTANLPIGQDTLSLAGTTPNAPTMPNYDIFGSVNEIAADAANATMKEYAPVFARSYDPAYNPGYKGPAYQMPTTASAQAKELSNYPNGEAIYQPHLMSFENLLSLLVPYSQGNISPGANGPNFYNIAQYPKLAPPGGGRGI